MPLSAAVRSVLLGACFSGAAPLAASAAVSFHALPMQDGNLPLVSGVSSEPPTAVGWLHGPARTAFRWTPATGFTLLPDLEGDDELSRALAISADGRVAIGYGHALDVSGQQAVRWLDGGPAQALGAPAGRQVFRSEPQIVSHDGNAIVGTVTLLGGFGAESFRWTLDAGMNLLGPPPGGGAFGPLRVSNDGSTILGWAYVEDPGGTGTVPGLLRWGEETGFVLLSTLPSDSWITQISADATRVVGDLGDEAFRWTETTGVVVLEPLPPNPSSLFDATSPDAMSADGRVVAGESKGRAFLWNAVDGMQPLQDLLHVRGVDFGDWYLESVTALSEDGCVAVGWATSPTFGAGSWLAELGCGTCRDALDDDGDGLVDLADPGCSDADDLDEHAPTVACDDGVDNDSDFRADFRPDGTGDLGCGSPILPREDPQCQDGFDNDGEPGTDFDGGASWYYGTPVDAPDPQCTVPWLDREASGCGLGFEVAPLLLLLLLRERRRRH